MNVREVMSPNPVCCVPHDSAQKVGKWFADLESTELLLPAGLPEVDFVESVQTGQEIEPITIRDSDEETHALSSTADKNVRRFYPRRSGF